MTDDASAASGPGRAERLLIAFDVSISLGSVALARGDDLLGERFIVDPRSQASRLVPTISELLEEAGLTARGIEGVVVGRGPGSFTGVRIAAATARGMAASLGIPVWPLSSLAAGAVSAWTGRAEAPPEADPAPGVGVQREALADAADRPRYVLFDAGGDRVYAAGYRLRETGVEVLLEPRAARLTEVLAGRPTPDSLFAGDGALQHARTLSGAGYEVLAFPSGIPMASALLRLHRLMPHAGPELPGSRWQPEYLRGSSARPPRAAGRTRG